MKKLEKYYRKFPFELTCPTRFVFLHKNLKNPIRYNLKKEKFGFVARWSSVLDYRKWVQCNVFQTLYIVSSYLFHKKSEIGWGLSIKKDTGIGQSKKATVKPIGLFFNSEACYLKLSISQ